MHVMCIYDVIAINKTAACCTVIGCCD